MVPEEKPGRARVIRVGLTLALGAAVFAVAMWIAGPARLADAFRRADPRLLALAGAAVVGLTLARGGLWSALLTGGGRRLAGTTAAATAIGWLIGHVFPFRAGIVVRAGLVAKRARVPLGQVLSSLAVERILDFSITALVAVAATLLFGRSLGAAFVPFVLLSGGVLLGLALLAFLVARRAPRLPAPLLRLVPASRRASVERGVASVHEGLVATVREPRRLGRALAWMTVVTACQMLFLGALVAAFLPGLPLGPLALGLPWLVLSFYLAFTPSQLGTFEGAFAAIYAPLGVPVQDALAAAILIHAAMIAFAMLLGGAAWALFAARADAAPAVDA